MSFSSNIKEELSRLNTFSSIKLVQAEFYGYLISNNTIFENGVIRFSTENEHNINRLKRILKRLNIEFDMELQGKIYSIVFVCKNLIMYQQINTEKDEIKKATVRGAYLGGGSLNNPNSKYHLEILFKTEEDRTKIAEIIKSFNIEIKYFKRNEKYSLYIKDGEEISKFLALIGANNSVLRYEEIRVEKDSRNSINRIVNCETANLNKTINASVYQIQAIQKIKKFGKFNELPDTLKEIADVRIENPNLSLTELGKLLKNPIGKSGVNHRLKKIIQLAEEIN